MSEPTPNNQAGDNTALASAPVSVTVSVADEDMRSEGYLAPSLRVEELRDGNVVLSAQRLASDDEGSGGGSHFEGSDADGERGATNTIAFVTPDDELQEKIRTQVNFYFSDANILHDAFLLKHVRRNKHGYVSLKLITSFKRLKSLTKDFRVVAFTLRSSDKLEINEEGTKVRRRDPLPEYDETTPSRSVVVINLPMENPSIETVAEIFSKCGEITLIRILRPGKSIPQDVKKHIIKHPEIGTTICAVIEFEKHEPAKVACETLTNHDDWRKGMRVVLLAATRKKDRRSEINSGCEEDNGRNAEPTAETEEKKKKRRGGRKNKNRLNQLTDGTDSSCCSSGSEAENANPRNSQTLNVSPNTLDPHWISPSNSPRSSPKSSPRGSPQTNRRRLPGKSPLAEISPRTSPRPSPISSPEMGRKRHDYSSGDSSPSSPWVQRRIKAAQELSPLTQNVSPLGSPLLGRRLMDGSRRMLDMEGVIRQPRGPNGNGFYGGQGRGHPIISPE